MGVDSKNRYRTPGPGAYDVRKASRQCLKNAPVVAFGGSLNRVDREKTGPLKVLEEKGFVPGPCSYAVEAEEQARDLCERAQTLIFGKAKRDDLSKLFFGKDAVAYIARSTPGPGTYELGCQRPVFRYPSREPGTMIGGSLANVDRVQTGPLGAAHRSDTPGPGAYDGTEHFVGRMTAGSGRNGYFSTRGPTSISEPGQTDTRGFGQNSWQLPQMGPKRPASTPSRRNPRASENRCGRGNGSRKRSPKSKGSASSFSAGNSRISLQSSSVARPVTTFGTGTREQAGQALAPGFKGYAPRSTIANPGPGAYRNVPGSLGLQVDFGSRIDSAPVKNGQRD